MTEKDLEVAKKLDARIKELEDEIMALFDAKGKKINPFKPFTIGKNRYGVEEGTTITLSGQDITKCRRKAPYFSYGNIRRQYYCLSNIHLL